MLGHQRRMEGVGGGCTQGKLVEGPWGNEDTQGMQKGPESREKELGDQAAGKPSTDTCGRGHGEAPAPPPHTWGSKGPAP